MRAFLASSMPKQVVKGRVIRGEGQGEGLGYPTANLDRRYFRMHPVAKGVYAGWVRFNRQTHPCLVIIGAPFHKLVNRPSKIEVYLLNFSGNLRNRYLEAELIRKIRPMKNFSKQSDLIRQIQHDIRQAKKIFNQ